MSKSNKIIGHSFNQSTRDIEPIYERQVKTTSPKTVAQYLKGTSPNSDFPSYAKSEPTNWNPDVSTLILPMGSVLHSHGDN